MSSLPVSSRNNNLRGGNRTIKYICHKVLRKFWTKRTCSVRTDKTINVVDKQRFPSFDGRKEGRRQNDAVWTIYARFISNVRYWNKVSIIKRVWPESINISELGERIHIGAWAFPVVNCLLTYVSVAHCKSTPWPVMCNQPSLWDNKTLHPIYRHTSQLRGDVVEISIWQDWTSTSVRTCESVRL